MLIVGGHELSPLELNQLTIHRVVMFLFLSFIKDNGTTTRVSKHVDDESQPTCIILMSLSRIGCGCGIAPP